MTFGRSLLLIVAIVLLAGLALGGWSYWMAISEPLVRRAEIRFQDWPQGARELRLVLVTDIHVAGPDMAPDRLERIVEQINDLRPDIVLVGGDLVSDKRFATRHYPASEALAPLAGLRPTIGSYAVLGNHDHWRDSAEIRAALVQARVRVLQNDAVQAGPVAIGGLDDAFTGHHDLAHTVARLRALNGPKILLSHSPDPFPDVPGDIVLMLAGHTHCGQVRLPFIGPLSTMSRHGDRYACGRVDEGGRTLIVSAGVGTSIVPLRLAAAPDIWLVELRPARAPSPRR